MVNLNTLAIRIRRLQISIVLNRVLASSYCCSKYIRVLTVLLITIVNNLIKPKSEAISPGFGIVSSMEIIQYANDNTRHLACHAVAVSYCPMAEVEINPQICLECPNYQGIRHTNQ